MLNSFSNLIFKTLNPLSSAARSANVRCMSRYGPQFIDPVVDPQEQKKIRESGDLQTYLFRPIKSAPGNYTCSHYFDPEVAKFTNILMSGGRKALCRELMDKTFEQIKRNQIERFNNAETDEERNAIIFDPLIIFHKAIENAKPIMKLLKIKRGGQTYQVPYPITENEKRFRAIKWLIEAGNDKPNPIHFPQRMAIEFIDAANNKGSAVKRKTELHRQCEANRAYAHYRWA
nr:PREDICTED: 28S ribosomal protein S7, mitochondrial [Bemisia tabaci]